MHNFGPLYYFTCQVEFDNNPASPLHPPQNLRRARRDDTWARSRSLANGKIVKIDHNELLYVAAVVDGKQSETVN